MKKTFSLFSYLVVLILLISLTGVVFAEGEIPPDPTLEPTQEPPLEGVLPGGEGDLGGLTGSLELFSLLAPVGQAGTTLTADVTGVPHWTRTITWTIDKSADPTDLYMFVGDSGSATWTIDVTKTVEEDAYIDGQVCVNNGGGVATEGLAISVELLKNSGGGTGFVTVSTDPVDVSGYPILYPTDTHCYGYSIDISSPDTSAEYKVTAHVTITNHSGHLGVGFGPDPSASGIFFTTPTLDGYETINVEDTNGYDGSFSDSGSDSYEETFTCGDDAGNHHNVATISETGQEASADVMVHCYELSIGKTVETTFTRSYTWDIDKSVDNDSLTLALNQSYIVNYTVGVSAIFTDSLWEAHGEITITNPAPMDATLTDVTDTISTDIAATVVCPSMVVLAEDSLVCTYSADLPDGTARTNTAVATQQNTPSGTTPYSVTEDVTFGDPAVEVDECIDVTDTLGGSLGTVCYGDLPESFTYPWTIGPYATCGDYTVDNTASFITNDTAATGEAGASVAINVPCGGCTLTIGYWKTHAGFGPQADMVTPLLPQWLGLIQVDTAAKAEQFLSFYGSNNVFSASNGINKLYAQLLGAKLNIANGADGSAISSTIFAADLFLVTHNSTSWSGLSKTAKANVLYWANVLDIYNNGFTGPGHCDQ